MTWDAYNRRKNALREVLAIADRHRSGRHREITATELLAEAEGANSAFANVDELLLEVQMNWFQRLSGRLDRGLGVGAEDLEADVTSAWAEIAAEMPGTRALLDANADMPALQRAYAKEHEFLARSAGVRGHYPDLIGHGQRIRETARESVVHADIPEIPDTPAGLFTRIREALAA
ncbi:hypothetical protein [Aeromicrobium sp.]